MSLVRGRPQGNRFKELNFQMLKKEGKYGALCNICKKVLHNSAQPRLQSHRNVCKPQKSNPQVCVQLIDEDEDEEDESQIVTENYEDTASVSLDVDPSDPTYSAELMNVDTNSVSSACTSNTGTWETMVVSEDGHLVKEDSMTSFSQLEHSDTESEQASKKVTKVGLKRSRQFNKIQKYVDVVTPEQIDKITEALGTFIFACNVPLSVVDSKHFHNFVKAIRPAYAEKIPSRKSLSTRHLDNIYEKTINRTKEKLKQDSTLIIDGWKNSSSNAKTVVTMLHCADGTQTFLDAYDLSGESENAEKLCEIVTKSIIQSKEIYKTNIYAVVSDNASPNIRMGNMMEGEIWHSTCSSHTGNLLAKDVLDKDINEKVTSIMKEMKHTDVEAAIVKAGGSRMKLACDTRWCSYRDSYFCLIDNLPIIKQYIASATTKKIKPDVVKLIFNDDFIEEVQECIDLLDPICKLINTCQSATCSIADAANQWLDLKLPRKFQTCLQKRQNMALNKYALTAFYLHPSYDNSKLDGKQRQVISAFLLENLDSDGIEEWDHFNEKTGIFRELANKAVEKPLVFWRMAGIQCKNLPDLALKLLRIPAASAQLERVFSGWGRVHSAVRNRLNFERSKKLAHLYYHLRLNDEIKIDDDWETELENDE